MRTRNYKKHDGTQAVANLNWRRQELDTRDDKYQLKLHYGVLKAIPSSVDLRASCSPVEDQETIGSCTANMLAGLVEANEVRGNVALLHATTNIPSVTVSNVAGATDGTISFTTSVKPVVQPSPTPVPPLPVPVHTFINVSRLFQYYATRKIEGTTGEDSGATIRDTLKAANKYGVLDETSWPYDTTKFTVNPPSSAWTTAALHKVTSYHSIADGDLNTMKSALAAGYLVGFGFNVYSYFLSQDMATKAWLHLPTKSEYLEGGHAVCLCGYDDTKQAFLVRNSWGTSWGLAGYFWMDYAYVANTTLCSDFWIVQASPV